MSHFSEQTVNVVKAYASFLKLSLVVTDRNGRWLLTEKGDSPLSHILFEKQQTDIQKNMEEILQGKWKSKQPIYYDIKPGIQVLIAPVLVKGEAELFIWAGVMTDQENRSLVEEQLMFSYGYDINWKELLQQTLDTDSAREQGMKESLANLAHFITLDLSEEETNTAVKKQAHLLGEASQIKKN
ncbi:hypothetical protein [Salsuginibacillus kocurii]|uniref:hypothetical protein n=1 Tax=Salsuginibacillus kocurii TaxID=427078 RepID=UPI00036DAF43|nr:hypothetical protein [Salsuginibacillus kocurii]